MYLFPRRCYLTFANLYNALICFTSLQIAFHIFIMILTAKTICSKPCISIATHCYLQAISKKFSQYHLFCYNAFFSNLYSLSLISPRANLVFKIFNESLLSATCPPNLFFLSRNRITNPIPIARKAKAAIPAQPSSHFCPVILTQFHIMAGPQTSLACSDLGAPAVTQPHIF